MGCNSSEVWERKEVDERWWCNFRSWKGTFRSLEMGVVQGVGNVGVILGVGNVGVVLYRECACGIENGGVVIRMGIGEVV